MLCATHQRQQHQRRLGNYGHLGIDWLALTAVVVFAVVVSPNRETRPAPPSLAGQVMEG